MAGRRPAALVAVAMLAVVTALASLGCSKGNETILDVNGWKLGRQDFLVQLDQIAHSTGYQTARRQNGQPFKVFKDGSTEEYTPEFVAEFLNERVTFQLAEAELVKRNLTVTKEDRERAVDVIANGFAPEAPGTTPGSTPPGSTPPGSTPPGTTASGASAAGLQVLDSLGSYRETLVTGVASLQVLQRALSADITTDDQLRKLYETTKDQVANQACVRHILIRAGEGGLDPTTGNAIPGTEVEYAAALDKLIALKARLDAGEPFEDVARASSEDTATKALGGDLGCRAKGRYVGPFEDAVWNQPVGLLGAPVKSSFGYHLVLVTDRRVRPFDEVKDDLREAVRAQGQEALQEWLTTATRDATVTVDPQFGTWDKPTGVIKPAGVNTNLTLVPDAGEVSTTTTSTAPPAVPRAASGAPAPTTTTTVAR
jgi:hypothetical protein